MQILFFNSFQVFFYTRRKYKGISPTCAAYSFTPIRVPARTCTKANTLTPRYHGIREWCCRETTQEDNAPSEHFGFQPYRRLNLRPFHPFPRSSPFSVAIPSFPFISLFFAAFELLDSPHNYIPGPYSSTLNLFINVSILAPSFPTLSLLSQILHLL